MTRLASTLILCSTALWLSACNAKKEEAPTASTSTAAQTANSNVPADGKYEGVTVDGKRVAMVSVMNGGTVVLVDIEGDKPRSWEEQYKRKGASLKPGQFDIHKTDANKDGSFEDDAIEPGLWLIDAKANLAKQ